MNNIEKYGYDKFLPIIENYLGYFQITDAEYVEDPIRSLEVWMGEEDSERPDILVSFCVRPMLSGLINKETLKYFAEELYCEFDEETSKFKILNSEKKDKMALYRQFCFNFITMFVNHCHYDHDSRERKYLMELTYSRIIDVSFVNLWKNWKYCLFQRYTFSEYVNLTRPRKKLC